MSVLGHTLTSAAERRALAAARIRTVFHLSSGADIGIRQIGRKSQRSHFQVHGPLYRNQPSPDQNPAFTEHDGS